MRLLFCKAKREKSGRQGVRKEGKEKIYLEQNDQQALRARTPLWSSFDARAVGTRLIEVIFFSSVLSIVVRPSQDYPPPLVRAKVVKNRLPARRF